MVGAAGGAWPDAFERLVERRGGVGRLVIGERGAYAHI